MEGGAGSADQSVAQQSRRQGHVCFYLKLELVLFGSSWILPSVYPYIHTNQHSQISQENNNLELGCCLYASHIVLSIISSFYRS